MSSSTSSSLLTPLPSVSSDYLLQLHTNEFGARSSSIKPFIFGLKSKTNPIIANSSTPNSNNVILHSSPVQKLSNNLFTMMRTLSPLLPLKSIHANNKSSSRTSSTLPPSSSSTSPCPQPISSSSPPLPPSNNNYTPAPSLSSLSFPLQSIWDFYDQPYGHDLSLIIQSIPTECAFIPYLSALFLVANPNPKSDNHNGNNNATTAATPPSPSVLCSFSESVPPYLRIPFSDKISELSLQCPIVKNGFSHDINVEKSFYAISWYPLLVDHHTSHDLSGSFLTFHSFQLVGNCPLRLSSMQIQNDSELAQMESLAILSSSSSSSSSHSSPLLPPSCNCGQLCATVPLIPPIKSKLNRKVEYVRPFGNNNVNRKNSTGKGEGDEEGQHDELDDDIDDSDEEEELEEGEEGQQREKLSSLPPSSSSSSPPPTSLPVHIPTHSFISTIGYAAHRVSDNVWFDKPNSKPSASLSSSSSASSSPSPSPSLPSLHPTSPSGTHRITHVDILPVISNLLSGNGNGNTHSSSTSSSSSSSSSSSPLPARFFHNDYEHIINDRRR